MKLAGFTLGDSETQDGVSRIWFERNFHLKHAPLTGRVEARGAQVGFLQCPGATDAQFQCVFMPGAAASEAI